ncbi:hypothetical protein RM553_11455 [Zunongwangia sp. F363]|uniref:PAC domain-containing protein n=1 Tax=Autumnicola tepida TaxID=3075595 RepID=A0ABU3CAS7_9FLAO|nr:hypothetical protein [Zunongwangia sp. F363]MDT0643448.1 hypothetical protein [Zunongwangia sp. F363]
MKQKVYAAPNRANLKGDSTYHLSLFEDSVEITGVVNIVVDITDFKTAKKHLSESEKRYRQIVETSQEGSG